MIDRFEVSTKPTFTNRNEKAFIQFGSLRDREPEFGIRNGQLILPGYVLLIVYIAVLVVSSDGHLSGTRLRISFSPP